MKTVSLELSKQLKEAGFPQDESGFWWMKLIRLPEWDKADPFYCEYFTEVPKGNPGYRGCQVVAYSPTAEEIDLPLGIYTGRCCDCGRYKTRMFEFHTNERPAVHESFEADIAADSRALMLLYLLKNEIYRRKPGEGFSDTK